MHRKGVPIPTIAEVEECEERYIRTLLSEAEAEQGAPKQPNTDGRPAPARKLSRRTAIYRTWEYAETHPAMTLGVADNDFWIRVVTAIHGDGDGIRLGIGEPGCRFQTRADLALLVRAGQFCAGDCIDVESWLQKLVLRGRLVDLDGVDIAIPVGLGLTPGENARGQLVARRAPKHPAAAASAQTVMLHMIPGGRSGGTEPPPPTEQKSELLFRKSGTETPIVVPKSGTETPIVVPNSVPDVAPAHAATAAANAKDSITLAAASATEGRAGDGTTIAAGGTENPPENPSGGTEMNLQRSPLAELTAELVALAGITRAADAEELGQVEAWLDAKFSAETMRGVIQIKRKQAGYKPPTKLTWFNGAMMDTRKANGRHPPVSVSPPAPVGAAAVTAPLSEADKALRDRLAAFKHEFPPSVADFGSDAKHAAFAVRWLDVADGWVKFGRHRDLKPPDFSGVRLQRAQFEMDLIAAEEALLEVLTDPDPPMAAD
jgi:hypothetical protein